MSAMMKHAAPVVQVALAPRVRIQQFAQASGLTDRAIEGKIATGKWIEGKQFFRDPEGGIWIDVEGVMRWVASGRQ